MTDGFSSAKLEESLETETIGRCVLHLPSVSSTMDAARAEAEDGAPHGLIVVADRQTRGQGRLGRAWISPPGNLYVTIVLRPESGNTRALAMIAPLATCEAMEETADVRACIKWPNDILIEGRKVAGVLIDVRLGLDAVDYALVGIGVNVALDPSDHPEIHETATSLEGESGNEIPVETLLASLLNHFESLYLAAHNDEAVYDAWRARLTTLGCHVNVRFGDYVEEGVAEDVDGEGNLLLRRFDGSVVALSAGDVTLSTENV
jgi:BirA family biotin operon repressor/biotin-[acetyl-CoA-carboxylase] ligase